MSLGNRGGETQAGGTVRKKRAGLRVAFNGDGLEASEWRGNRGAKSWGRNPGSTVERQHSRMGDSGSARRWNETERRRDECSARAERSEKRPQSEGRGWRGVHAPSMPIRMGSSSFSRCSFVMTSRLSRFLPDILAGGVSKAGVSASGQPPGRYYIMK